MAPTAGAAAPAAAPEQSGDRSPASADDQEASKRAASGAESSRPEASERAPRSPGVVFVNGVPTELLLGLVAFALTAAGLAIGLLREHRRYREVERDALTDPLTGLANRIAFEHQLALDWQRAARYDRPLGVLMLDLDDFKHINDTSGHAAGDRVLRTAAETIARQVRGGDVAARLGGDEFVVLAAETPTDGLDVLAGRLRRALEEDGIAASIGCAERAARDDDSSQVLDRADRSMYRDKQDRKAAEGRAAGSRR